LSRMRSPMTSRSNWAKESSTLSVSRPIEVVVLNCWVTATNIDQQVAADPARSLGSEQIAPGLVQLLRAESAEILDFRRDVLDLR
jgi:hypothetical protein